MKKSHYFKLLMVGFLGLLIQSCTVIKQPYYTTMDKIYNLKDGWTVKQTTNFLGVKPHEVYYSTDGNGMVLSFKYKRNHHRIIFLDEQKEPGLKNGSPRYRDAREIYLQFDDKRKLTGYVTTEGRKQARGILGIESDLYYLLNNPEHYKKYRFGGAPAGVSSNKSDEKQTQQVTVSNVGPSKSKFAPTSRKGYYGKFWKDRSALGKGLVVLTNVFVPFAIPVTAYSAFTRYDYKNGDKQ